jgi:hypothetical protein
VSPRDPAPGAPEEVAMLLARSALVALLFALPLAGG